MAAGAVAWVGAAASLTLHVALIVFAAIVAIVLLARGNKLLFLILLGSLVAGAGAAARGRARIPAWPQVGGVVEVDAIVKSDVAPIQGGWGFTIDPYAAVASGRVSTWVGPGLAVRSEAWLDIPVGARIVARGKLAPLESRLHRRSVVGWLAVREVTVVAAPGPALRIANAVRRRVQGEFPAVRASGALVRGILIGDTVGLSDADLDDLRRAGLLHFVAVSGGNVAIFLAGVWLVLGVVPMSPRARAGVGLVGIGLFVLITRWEPSVVRAGLMMGLILFGRLAGFPVDGFTALGAAATGLLLVAPELALELGFQLSVLATTGLLVGAELWAGRKPAFLWRALAATSSAQVAVTPLLLGQFGSVPAFSAVANVVAAPLVALGTAAGWAQVFPGVPWAGQVAEWCAAGVLEVARRAGDLPQVGVTGLVLVASVFLVARWRLSIAVVAVGAALVAASLPVPPPQVPVAIFLDVGEGDAILLRSPGGEVVAVDTGPDPVSYAAALRRHNISRIDLLILTHGDADHAGGIGALSGRIPVSEVWYPEFAPGSDFAAARELPGAVAVAVRSGRDAAVGAFRLSTLGPGRRFATDNDGSVVTWVEAAGTTLLLAGDVEAVAQNELPALRPDVLLAPHHGSATSDLSWLEATVGPVVVLSYGENPFGHPSTAVLDLLQRLEVDVRHTADGDVVVWLQSGRFVVGSGVENSSPARRRRITRRLRRSPSCGRRSTAAASWRKPPGMPRVHCARMPPRTRPCTGAKSGT